MSDTAPTNHPAAEPLLWTAEQCSKACNISRASWFALQAAGAIPSPVLHRGHIVRWLAEEIRDWCKAGTPSRDVWEAGRGRRRA